MPIFHALFLVDAHGEHPQPYTLVSAEDVRQGRWSFNLLLPPVWGSTLSMANATSSITSTNLLNKGNMP
jgi:hypothetical protein